VCSATKPTDKIASLTNLLKMIRLKTLSVLSSNPSSVGFGRNSRQNDNEGFLEHASIRAASLLLFDAPDVLPINNRRRTVPIKVYNFNKLKFTCVDGWHKNERVKF
jgi:hypothetical protein